MVQTARSFEVSAHLYHSTWLVSWKTAVPTLQYTYIPFTLMNSGSIFKKLHSSIAKVYR
jgi:hypothetical protein